MDKSNFHKFTSFSVHQAPLCKLDGAIVQFIKLPRVLIVMCDRIPDFTWSFVWSLLDHLLDQISWSLDYFFRLV